MVQKKTERRILQRSTCTLRWEIYYFSTTCFAIRRSTDYLSDLKFPIYIIWEQISNFNVFQFCSKK